MELKYIESRKDIESLVQLFYQDLTKDELVGPYFTEVVKVNWESHLPTMYDFWENTLFHLSKYKGNPMLKHIELSKKRAIEPKHFERWLKVWQATVRNNFKGDNAEKAIKKAQQIASLMQIKINT